MTVTLLTLDGRTQSLRRWAAEAGVPESTLSGRLGKGMPLAEALRAVPRATRRASAPRGATAADVGRTYTDEEREFLRAVDRYKRSRGRVFPALTEILAVAKSLGYRRPEYP